MEHQNQPKETEIYDTWLIINTLEHNTPKQHKHTGSHRRRLKDHKTCYQTKHAERAAQRPEDFHASGNRDQHCWERRGCGQRPPVVLKTQVKSQNKESHFSGGQTTDKQVKQRQTGGMSSNNRHPNIHRQQHSQPR